MAEKKTTKAPTKAKSEGEVKRVQKMERNSLTRKLLTEKKVKVMGDPLYAKYLGAKYTFLFQGYPVKIVFDGTEQEFPATVAKFLKKKLIEIGRNNARVNVNIKI